MFKGQKYQPSTTFQFVNYEQSSSGVFREPKRQKLNIPNTMKFQLANTPPKSTSPDPNLPTLSTTVPVSHTHTFVADNLTNSPKTCRKASYTILTTDQKTKLIELIQRFRVYSSKPKLDAWNEVVKSYNAHYNLDDREGLTIQHARIKLNQIITTAENKDPESLSKPERMALDYNKERLEFKNDVNKDLKLDKRYENKNPKLTKVYELILKLQQQLEKARDSNSGSDSDNSFKTELWLLHKRVLDLKTIEEQYQILEQVDYSKEGARVKVSKEMRDELLAKAEDIQLSLDKLLSGLETTEKNGDGEQKESPEVVNGNDVVDSELLNQKESE